EVKAALGGMGEVEPPFGFYDRMLRQGTPHPEVGSATERRRGASRLARPLVAAAAAAVAAAAALVVIGGSAPEGTVVPPIEAVAAGRDGGVGDLRTVEGDAGPVHVLRQEAGGVRWRELP